MSTPFPLEEQGQQDQLEGRADPWSGPAKMSIGAEVIRSPYTVLEAMGSGAAKGQAVLGGLLHTPMAPDESEMFTVGLSREEIDRAQKQAEQMQQHGADAFLADARARVRALTPDPTTTGTATQMLHGVAEGAYLLSSGALAGGAAGAAATVGSVEGGSRYQELKEQGVDTKTAAASGAVTAITSAAGAFMPAAYGSTLATRLLTGAASNTAFGTVNRAADHLILEAGGYQEMADQQKVWDGTQMLVDAALGATFGGIHHALTPAESIAVKAVQSPESRDAALAVNLSLKDRQAAPGVAVDPAAANAHQAALEKAQTDLLQGKAVDVADTGVEQARFLARPERDVTPETRMVLKTFKESGLLDEEANLADLEEQFAQRRAGKSESVKPDTTQEAAGYSVQEEPLTDEQQASFQGLRSDVQTDQELGGGSEGVSEGSGGPDDGAARKPPGEPLTVYRGAHLPLAPEHFDAESLGKATGHPSSGLGVFFTNDAEEAARYGDVTAHHLDIRNPKVLGPGDLPGFDSLEDATKFREELRAQGHDGITLDYSSVGGPVQHIAFEPKQVIPASPREPLARSSDPVQQALADHPNLSITEDGQPVKAADALEAAQPETDWFTATKAAIDCFSRRGS